MALEKLENLAFCMQVNVGFETCSTVVTDCRVDGGPVCGAVNQFCDPACGRCATPSMLDCDSPAGRSMIACLARHVSGRASMKSDPSPRCRICARIAAAAARSRSMPQSVRRYLTCHSINIIGDGLPASNGSVRSSRRSTRSRRVSSSEGCVVRSSTCVSVSTRLDSRSFGQQTNSLAPRVSRATSTGQKKN